MLISSQVPQAPLIKKIENYIFKFADKLGQGNFSKVYKGSHQITNQIVAIKVIQLNSLKSPKLQELLFSEIEILKKLNHPNILKCYEVFSSNRNCYIVTQLCNQGDLETKLRSKHHFSENQAEKYIVDVFKGLQYLAQNNIIHRDLKVANIFLNNGTAKIADFGFSKHTLTNFKDINIGSPVYMAPEGFIQNIYGPKTDVWAFGIFMYELLHGRTPYSHCQNEIQLRKQIINPLTYSNFRTELSFEIKDIILKCLEINEQRRITIQKLGHEEHIVKMMKKQESESSSQGYFLNSVKKQGRRGLNEIENRRSLKVDQHYSVQKTRMQVKSFQDPQINNPTLSNPNKFAPINFMAPFQTPNYIQKAHNNQVSIQYQNKDPLTLVKRPFSAQKKMQRPHGTIHATFNPNRDINKTDAFNFIDVKKPSLYQRPSLYVKKNLRLIPGILSFKESVNTLHYCRLIYKYLVLSREDSFSLKRQFTNSPVQNGSALLNQWMFQILEEINKKIMNKQIMYEDDFQGKKQSKLQEVTSEYLKKYLSDVGKSIGQNQLDFDNVIYEIGIELEYLRNLLEQRKDDIGRIQQVHFLLVMTDATRMLKKCSESIRFQEWQEYREIEDFLSQNKNSFSYQTFLALEQKLNRR